jgi:hypothetical protein
MKTYVASELFLEKLNKIDLEKILNKLTIKKRNYKT